jgi:hypothetical protein
VLAKLIEPGTTNGIAEHNSICRPLGLVPEIPPGHCMNGSQPMLSGAFCAFGSIPMY